MTPCGFRISGVITVSILSLMLIVGSCQKSVVNLREMVPEEQFETAKSVFDKKDYTKARGQFLLIVMNNPGSMIIEKAQFYLAESYFMLKEYVLAIEEYEKLIRSLPQSPYVDDAQFKIGLCYYELAPGYALDQEYTRKAITQFQMFLEDYPESELRPDVEAKLDDCRIRLAKKEYKSGELYRKMNYFQSALIYFDEVLEKYYDTDFADDALFWKGECHRRLKQWDEAESVFRDLIDKYGQSDYREKAQQRLEEVLKDRDVQNKGEEESVE